MPVVQQRELFRFGLLGARTYAHRNYYIEWLLFCEGGNQ